MGNNKLRSAAKLMGLPFESLAELPEDTKDSMITVMNMFDIDSENDAADALAELRNIWKAAIRTKDITEIAAKTGILPGTLRGLSSSVQDRIIFEYYINGGDAASVYTFIQTELAISSLPDVAKFLDKEVSDLEALSTSVQEQLCGMYSVEHGITDDEELRESLMKLVG